MNAVLEQIFPSRIRAVRALRKIDSAADVSALEPVAQALRDAASLLARAPAAKLWLAFSEAVECVRLLQLWRLAVLSGEIDSDRYVRAARARLDLLTQSSGATVFEQAILDTLQPIKDDMASNTVQQIAAQIAAIPMPVAIYADPEPTRPEWATRREDAKDDEPEKLAVAFLEFLINGMPAEHVHFLPSRQTNDLELLIRVSRWPDGAERIRLSPISIEPESTFDLPVFEFAKPAGEPPYHFKQRGRMVLHAPQSFHARPYEFLYLAEFDPMSSEQPVVVAGQRTLRLDGTDINQNPITGYAAIDRKILNLRESMRLEPLISEGEASDALILLAAFGNLMGQAVQDARYPQAMYESEFQTHVRQFLRQYPQIGSQLEEQAQSTGGRTDLSFRGIRIELKSERERLLTPDDCKQWAGQAASYAAGTNRRLALLCVLDASPKTRPPFPAEDGMVIIPVETSTSPLYVITFLIQGGLAKPSSLSA